MNTHTSTEERFSEDERGQLEAAWPTLDVPMDFADRVAQRWASEAGGDTSADASEEAAEPVSAALNAASTRRDAAPGDVGIRPWSRQLGRAAAIALVVVGMAAGGVVAVSRGWISLPGQGDRDALEGSGSDAEETPDADAPLVRREGGKGDANPEESAPTFEGVGGATTPPVLPLPSVLPSKIEAYLRSYGRNYGPAFDFTGVVLVARGEEVVEVSMGTMGVGREGEPSASTVFRLGALTQPLVAVAARRMKLDLDLTLGACLPETPKAWHGVTMRALVEHRSGIPNFTDSLLHAMRRTEVHEDAELWAYVGGEELSEDAGEFEPSNTNYVLLGACLERRGETSLAQILEREVFEPAGMTTAVLGLGHENLAAAGTTFDELEIREPATRLAPSAWSGAGAVSASARDLLAFHRALRDERLLDGATQAEMYAGPEDAPSRAGVAGYGQGWTTTRSGGDYEVGHPGGLDGFNAQIFRRLHDDTLVVVLVNSDTLDARVVANAVVELIDGGEVEPVREYEEIDLRKSEYRPYLGTYRLSEASRARYEKVVDPDRLALMKEVEFVLDERPAHSMDRFRAWMRIEGHGETWMHPSGPDEFFFKDLAGTTLHFGFERGETKASWVGLRSGDIELILRRAD